MSGALVAKRGTPISSDSSRSKSWRPINLYRWFADWMNQQLSDIGVNSTGGIELPPLRYETVRVRGGEAHAHVFEADEYSFIVVTQPPSNGKRQTDGIGPINLRR
jgi:hypothetical protein